MILLMVFDLLMIITMVKLAIFAVFALLLIRARHNCPIFVRRRNCPIPAP